METVKFSFIESPTLRQNTAELSSAAKNAVMRETSGKFNPFQTTTVKWSKEEIDKFVHSPVVFSGHEFEGGKRNRQSYLQTNVLIIDMDDDMTPGQALDILNKIPGSPLYHLSYSSNHSPGKVDKMHIVMPLSEPFISIEEHDLLAEWVLLTFEACDSSVRTDVARGIIRSNPKFISQTVFGGVSPLSKEHILDQAITQKIKAEIQINQELAANKEFSLALESTVYDEDRHPFTIKQLMERLKSDEFVHRSWEYQKIPIFCPVCGFDTQVRSEKNPKLLGQNAFIRIGKNGAPYINCRSCQARGEGIDKKGSWFLEDAQKAKIIQKQNNFIIFKDTITDRWYKGFVCPNRKRFVFDPLKSHASIIHAFWELGKIENIDPKKLPSAVFKLDFSNPAQIDFDNYIVNRYVPTTILQKTDLWVLDQPDNYEHPLPKNTYNLIKHLSGDDEEMTQLFIDWLAYIYQKRTKTYTAFLFQGIQGTGKDFMLKRVIKPIFGESYCQVINQDRLASQFNSMFEENIFLVLNEVQTDFSSTENANKVAACMKMAISDTSVAVEGKGVDLRHGDNNANIIAFSNKPNAVKLEQGDRRFNVCPRQEVKLKFAEWLPVPYLENTNPPEKDPEKFESIIQAELEDFAKHLATRQYRPNIHTYTHTNEAKLNLMSITQTYTEQFFEHVKPGEIDWEWLEDALADYPWDIPKMAAAAINMRKTLPPDDDWHKVLSKTEMKALYENICNNGKVTNTPKFKNLLVQHGLTYDKQVRINGSRERPVTLINGPSPTDNHK